MTGWHDRRCGPCVQDCDDVKEFASWVPLQCGCREKSLLRFARDSFTLAEDVDTPSPLASREADDACERQPWGPFSLAPRRDCSCHSDGSIINATEGQVGCTSETIGVISSDGEGILPIRRLRWLGVSNQRERITKMLNSTEALQQFQRIIQEIEQEVDRTVCAARKRQGRQVAPVSQRCYYRKK